MVYELSLASAVSRGLLARYQIVVVELTDPVVTPARLVGEERREKQLRGERIGALQATLLETMTVHDLQTTITFHHRTIEASAFAEGLPRVAQDYASKMETHVQIRATPKNAPRSRTATGLKPGPGPNEPRFMKKLCIR